MHKLSIAYFGTPYFSAQFLEKLIRDTDISIEIKLVVTQPDQPVGRKHILTKTPVKMVAQAAGLKVLTPRSSISPEELKGIDMAFLFAYGNVIPKAILNTPRFGFLNTHPSLLPLYRGPGPIVYPLILGDKKTGVTLIRLDEKIDHGPIIAQQEVDLAPTIKRPELETQLTHLAYNLFKKTIQSRDKDLKETPQDHDRATFTRQLSKDDGFIPFPTLKQLLTQPPTEKNEVPRIIHNYADHNKITIDRWGRKGAYNLFRGLYPWPGIWTKIMIHNQEKRLKITGMQLENDELVLKKVQLEGKKEVDYKTFQQAYSIF